jgi:hypothetical protein
MEAIGNAVANAYYEASIPARYVMPKDGDSVRVWEKFIRDKYEHKKFIVPGSTFVIPDKHASAEGAVSSHKEAVKSSGNIKIAPASMPTKVVEAPSLLDFMDTDSSPPATTSTATSATVHSNELDGFGDFSTGSFATTATTATTAASTDFFGGSSGGSAPPTQQVLYKADYTSYCLFSMIMSIICSLICSAAPSQSHLKLCQISPPLICLQLLRPNHK